MIDKTRIWHISNRRRLEQSARRHLAIRANQKRAEFERTLSSHRDDGMRAFARCAVPAVATKKSHQAHPSPFPQPSSHSYCTQARAAKPRCIFARESKLVGRPRAVVALSVLGMLSAFAAHAQDRRRPSD